MVDLADIVCGPASSVLLEESGARGRVLAAAQRMVDCLVSMVEAVLSRKEELERARQSDGRRR